jgi:uncharacterized protein HemX
MPGKKKTIKQKIKEALKKAGRPMALHEFDRLAIGTNESSISACIRTLAKDGEVIGERRQSQKGIERYKEWVLAEDAHLLDRQLEFNRTLTA